MDFLYYRLDLLRDDVRDLVGWVGNGMVTLSRLWSALRIFDDFLIDILNFLKNLFLWVVLGHTSSFDFDLSLAPFILSDGCVVCSSSY